MKQNLLTKSILTLVMLVMSVTAWADYFPTVVDNFAYMCNTDTHTARVTSSPTYSGNIEIPSTITINGEKYTVTEISNYAFRNTDVETVKLPNTVTRIYSEAFLGCKKLTSIDLVNSVTTIDAEAFDGCENLNSVYGCESVEAIQYDAFRNVPWVENQPDGVVYIGKSLYKYNGAMPTNTSIVIKEGTVQVCYGAFMDCNNLVAVTFPSTISRIDSYAFLRCTELSTISLPLSAIVSYIGEGVFSDTKWLKDQPKGVVYFGNVLYGISGYINDESLDIKAGTTIIAPRALKVGCPNLTSVTLPNSLIGIGKEAFQGKSITSIDIPSSVKTIGSRAFQGTSLISVNIPNSIETIDDETFEGCRNLQTVILPPNIKYIFSKAFARTSIKEMLCFSEIVPNPSGDAFNNVKLEDATLYVPESALEAYRNTVSWSRFGTIKSLKEREDAVAPTLSRSQLHVSSTTYSSVTLTWIKATDNFTPKEELLYSVYVNGELFKQGRDMASCVVTDLKPSTSYTFLVRVEDYRGNVTKYDGARATTDAKPVVIEKYPVLIEYTQITSENATDFWGDGGSIKYDPATKTLTLAWADLSSDDDAICIYDDITIKLIGQNTVKGSIYADYTGELTFAGEGAINVKGEYPLNGWLSALVLKDGCTVELDATGYDSPGLGLDDCLLGVDHSTLKVKGGKGNRSIRAVTTFWMEGSEFESNHSYDKVNYMFLDATGKEATDEIIIAPIIKKIPMIADNSITVVDVDNTSATIAWMAATDDTTPQSELTYYIYSMKDGDYDFMYDADSKGMTSYTFTNLKPGTEYYVRIKVVDKDNNQVFYQDTSFTTTTPDTSAPTLSDDEIRVTEVKENIITIEWTKASDDRTAEDQLVYEVVYADNSSLSPNYAMVLMDRNTATLKNLTPSTTYYIKVNVSDEARNLSEYRMLSVTTIENLDVTAPTLADSKINVDGVTETSIAVSWTAATDDCTAQDKLEYIVECTEAITGASKEFAAGNANQYDITGLEPNTSYFINVVVKDEAGNFNRYDTVEARTNEAPDVTAPTLADTKIVVGEVTENTIAISWTPATDDRTAQEKLEYTVECTDATGATTDYAVGSDTQYLIVGLADNTTYLINVVVKDEAGNFNRYDDVKVQTLETADVAAPILSDARITVTDVTETTIALSWTAADDNRTSQDMLEYTVEYMEPLGEWITVDVQNNTSYTITELTPGVSYLIGVTVKDEAGNSVRYDDIEVTTTEAGIEGIVIDASPDAIRKYLDRNGVRIRRSTKVYDTNGTIIHN